MSVEPATASPDIPDASADADERLRVRVAVPGPLRQLFDYKAENGKSIDDYPPGSRVEVPFGRRRLIGYVAGQPDQERAGDHPRAELSLADLKPVTRQVDADSPILTPELLQLANWIADYYHHPLGDCIACMLPGLLTGPDTADQRGYTRRVWRISTHGLGLDSSSLARAPRQQALLNTLREGGEQSDQQLQQAGHKLSAAHELAKKGLVEQSQQNYLPEHCEAIVQGGAETGPLALNEEQQQALRQIEELLGDFGTLLLEGVTGSGKTEIYLQAIAQVLARGQQVLVLVPEIGLTPQTVARFARRFACQISVLHSGLNDRERLAGWLAAGEGQSRIVIGTRSAIFTPLANPGLIVVDEEHDASFKQQEGLRYHARDVAVVRGQFENIPVLLGSATPSLESLANARRGKYQHAQLRKQASAVPPAAIELVDIRRVALHEGLADSSIQAISQTLDAGEQVLVFINRRGFAPLLMCHDCGWSAECEHCDARLTLHLSSRQLRCHHCDHRRSIPQRCPRCQSGKLQHLGEGTERCSEALRQLLPGTEVIRIDRDTVSSKHALSQHIETINRNQPLVVVGTQMLAKGHDFKKLNTVIVLNVDDGLYQADFRAAEKTLQLLTQVAGRAGRSRHGGRVLIQTHLPDHPVLQDWIAHSYQGIGQQLLDERQARSLPPFGYMALLRADSPRQNAAMQFLAQVAQLAVQQQQLSSHCIGPLPALMQRRAGRHRAQLLYKSTSRRALHSDIETVLHCVGQIKKTNGLRWSIDIDPLEAI